jgi:hypothetical protein
MKSAFTTHELEFIVYLDKQEINTFNYVPLNTKELFKHSKRQLDRVGSTISNFIKNQEIKTALINGQAIFIKIKFDYFVVKKVDYDLIPSVPKEFDINSKTTPSIQYYI